ncbi:putative adhesin [Pelagibaculum spongiae]|uniref:Putative adhesin Stv domain-containing protein n=1 Tax=Pelagibaculum spongiae TaxID=2080658 RepID=A0A2V1H0G9_9GAMM|nr:hypothetical protein [Pelagibaculum spongiae]PVZ72506.1 hypothetical protein DC094_05755 [Pelagibaculum spongiae]
MANIKKKSYTEGFDINFNEHLPAAQLIVSSHGSKCDKDLSFHKASKYFKLPRGIDIWFYCPDDHELSSYSVIDFSRLDSHPYEIYKGGAMCPNYYLTYFEDTKSSIEGAARLFELWTVMTNNGLGNEVSSLGEFRPVDILTIQDNRLSGFLSIFQSQPRKIVLTLEEVVRRIELQQSNPLFCDRYYSAILCSFCRTSRNRIGEPPSYMFNRNSEDNIIIHN